MAVNKNLKKDELKTSSPKSEKDIIVEHKRAIDLEEAKRKTDAGKSGAKGNLLDILKEKIAQRFKANKSSWEVPRIIKTNLIRGEITSHFDWKNNLLVLLRYFAVALVFVVIVFVGLSYWEMNIEKQGVDIKDEVFELEENVLKKEEEIAKIKLFHQKVTVAGALLDKHIYWSNFFEFLENNILEDVYLLGGFNGNTSGEYPFSAIAKDYNTMAAQLMVLENSEDVDTVVMSGGSASVSGDLETGRQQENVSFNFSISLRKKFFLKEESKEESDE